MDRNTDESIIVKSTIDLALNLELTVVAEGIENSQILQQLQAYHCNVGQGFLLVGL